MRILVAVLVVLAGCQPMYGAKSERLRSPAPIKPPVGYGTEAAVTVVYDEGACAIPRSAPAAPKAGAKAEALTVQGDTKVQMFGRTADPKQKSQLIIDGIDDYRRALTQDPYSAEATLKLAVAYDKVLRKTCALALLSRLAKLAENPRFAPEANARIDQIIDGKTYFEGYRREAVQALGR